MPRLISIRKTGYTTSTRFNTENESRDNSMRMTKSANKIIELRKSSEPSNITRRYIRSNTIM